MYQFELELEVEFSDHLGWMCSGSLIPDSPLSGRLPLEGDCLDEETTFIFPGVQTGSCRAVSAASMI
jgi:hypothetical protein